MHFSLAADPIEHVVAHDLFHFGFTNTMLMSLVAAALMLLIFPRVFSHASADAPTGARNFFESILEFLRIEVFRPALKEHTERFVPFLWTVFFFILFCNVLGLIPFTSIFTLLSGGRLKDLGGTATGNINTTATLAICAFFVIHISGIAQVAQDLIRGTHGHHGNGHEGHMRGDALPADVPQDFRATMDPTHHYTDGGHAGQASHAGRGDGSQAHSSAAGMNAGKAWLLALPLYLWNFAPHPFRPAEGESPVKWLMDIPMWLLLLVLEMLGAIIKPFALAIRLFANMIAGHLVLAALLTLILLGRTLITQVGIAIPVIILSLLISLLEVFVAFLQAYIFTFLTTLFIASAVAPEH